jgi:flagellar basal body-associated protein FliL
MEGIAMSASQNNKGRKIRSIIILVASFLLIIAIAGTAYAFRDYLMNSYARMTKSPAEYYAYIEKKNVAAIVDTLIPANHTEQEEFTS